MSGQADRREKAYREAPVFFCPGTEGGVSCSLLPRTYRLYACDECNLSGRLSSQPDRAAINLPPCIPSIKINESKWLGTTSRHIDERPLAVPWMGPADQMVVKKRRKGGDINS